MKCFWDNKAETEGITKLRVLLNRLVLPLCWIFYCCMRSKQTFVFKEHSLNQSWVTVNRSKYRIWQSASELGGFLARSGDFYVFLFGVDAALMPSPLKTLGAFSLVSLWSVTESVRAAHWFPVRLLEIFSFCFFNI